MRDFDVIVVGAGNGGLAAASFMSQKGYKTLLLEKHNIPGGSATSFRRGRFEFEPSLHEMAEVGPESKPGRTRKMFEELNVSQKLIYEDKLYRVISLDESEPYDVTLPAGVDAFIDKMEELVPGCKKSVRAFFDIVEQAVSATGKMTGGGLSLKDIPSVLNTLRMASHSADNIMDMLGIPKKAQHIMCTYWPYIGEPTNSVNAVIMGMILHTYVEHGAGIPENFSHEMSLAVEQSIRKNGGQIWYNSPVEKILIKNKKAYGVVVNGKEIYSDHVICNCFPDDVFGHMVEKSEVPVKEIKKSNAREFGLSFVNVYLGINKTAEELGIKDYTIFIQDKADSKQQYELSFGLGGAGWIIGNCLNVINPKATPEGTCEISITTSVYGDAWGDVLPEDYKKTKMQLAEKMIKTYEKSLGISVMPYIEEIEVATPVTFSRYLNTPNGTPYGYQTGNWDDIFTRTVNAGREDTVKGLRFCGAHQENSLGYNMTYLSGIAAAERTIKDMKKAGEKKGGAK
ncbi:MAG: NAD(P)-binding protein [Treponema sp.]|nr:NAD(P)-binding protein [Treponema sp.]